jgi:hypothetical protein
MMKKNLKNYVKRSVKRSGLLMKKNVKNNVKRSGMLIVKRSGLLIMMKMN